MTIDKAKLDSLFSEAYKWLRTFDEIDICAPIRLLIEQMKKAVDEKDYTKAWLYVDQLEELADKIRGNLSTEAREQSLMRVECACAAYHLGNLRGALKLLQTTLEMYDRNYGRHYEATLTWMLGCVQWQIPDQRNNAILSWESSIEMFQDLVKRSLDLLNITRSTWYSNRVTEMNAAFELAIKPPESPEARQPSSTDSSESLGPDVRAETPETMDASMSNGDFLRWFRVRNEVAAGAFSASSMNPASFGYVEINQFQIDGRAHYLVNLRKSGRVIKTIQGKDYDVVRVTGESMTAEGIDDGDYVLLRIQETAEHNDIVAAQIHSIDPEATLKKFLIERNKFILRFRSNNKMYKYADGRDMEFQFNGYNHEKFQIIGIAIAVFKPLHATS